MPPKHFFSLKATRYASKSADEFSVSQGATNIAENGRECIVSLSSYRQSWIGRQRAMERLQERQDILMHRQIKVALKEYRLMKGWNQATMADFLRITKDNYQKYELNNKQGPLVKVPVVVFMRFCAQTDQNPLDLVFPRSKRATW